MPKRPRGRRPEVKEKSPQDRAPYQKNRMGRGKSAEEPGMFPVSMGRLNRRLGVFVVGDVFQPDDVAAVFVCFLQG